MGNQYHKTCLCMAENSWVKNTSEFNKDFIED